MHIRALVVNRRVQRGQVYIGRPGPYGNPVELGKPCPRCGMRHVRDAAAVECTAAVLLERLQDRAYRALVAELAGKVLECWCAPAWCHGELLAVYADAYSERLAICDGELNTEETAHLAGVRALRIAVDKSSKKNSRQCLTR